MIPITVVFMFFLLTNLELGGPTLYGIYQWISFVGKTLTGKPIGFPNQYLGFPVKFPIIRLCEYS